MNLKKCVLLVATILFISGPVFSKGGDSDHGISLEDLRVPDIKFDENQIKYVDKVLPSLEGEYFVKLNSGLTLLVKEIDFSPVVSCRVTIKAGSIFEGKYLGCGISHYLEHIISGGSTELRSETDNNKILKEIGNASNASTSYDHTTFFIDTTTQHWEKAVNLLYSYIAKCKFDESEVQREKNVILQELRMKENEPPDRLWQLFVSTAYQTDPLRYPIIGYEELFKNLKREDLVNYYNERYQPQNVVFSVVGNIDGIKVINELINITKDFLPKQEFSYPLIAENKQISPRWAQQVHPASRLPAMLMGFPTVSIFEKDLYPLDVLAIILGDGRTSRLYKSLKDQKQLVLSVNTLSWTPFTGKGQFIFMLDLDYKNIEPTISAIREEIQTIQNEGVSQKELERAKRKVVAEHIFSNQKTSSISSDMSYCFLINEDPHFSERYIAQIKEVTSDDLKRVAGEYFDFNKKTVAIVKPQETKDTVTTSSQKKRSESEIEKITLPNGVRILLKTSSEYPLVDYKLFLNGGLRFENENESGVSNFMANMITRGTKKRTKQQISELIENIGGALSCSSANNTVSIECSVLSDDVNTGYDVFSDVILNPDFPKDEMEKLRKEILLTLEKLDESWETEIMRFLAKNFYKNHPYRNDILGAKEFVSKADRGDLMNFYDRIFVPENMVIAVFGNFDKDKMIKKLKDTFGNLKSKPLVKPDIKPEFGENLKGDTKIEKISDKYSVSIMIGYKGMSVFDKDKPALDVLDSVISGIGYPSGWLQESLRGNDSSLVYMVHAFPQYGIDGGYFAIMSQTTSENYDKVMGIINKCINKAKTEGITKAELDTGKNICVTMMEMGLETMNRQAYNAALNESIGLGYDYTQKYLEAIKKVTKEDVDNAAKKYFANSLTVTVFPKDYKKSDKSSK